MQFKASLLSLLLFLVFPMSSLADIASDPGQINHITNAKSDGTKTTQLREYDTLFEYNWLENTDIGKANRWSDDRANNPSSRMGFYIKDKVQLDEYFNTYGRPKNLKTYKDKYAKAFELAATATKMPYALSTCVAFRETYFNEKAESEAGARSIVQFMEPTYNEIRAEVVATLNGTPCKGSWCKKLRDEMGYDVVSYTEMAQVAKIPRKHSYPPKSFDEFVKDPYWVAFMNQYYLKRNAIALNGSLNKKGFQKSDDILMYPMLLACTYHSGPSRAKNTLKKPNQSLKSVCEACAASGKRARNYMLSVRRCMLQQGFDEPTGYGHVTANQRNGASQVVTDNPCDPVEVKIHQWRHEGGDDLLMRKNRPSGSKL